MAIVQPASPSSESETLSSTQALRLTVCRQGCYISDVPNSEESNQQLGSTVQKKTTLASPVLMNNLEFSRKEPLLVHKLKLNQMIPYKIKEVLEFRTATLIDQYNGQLTTKLPC